MLTKLQIAKGVLAAIVIHDTFASAKIKTKYGKTLENNIHLQNLCVDLKAALDSHHEQLSYVIHMLNEHDIAFDEFDLIALPNVEIKAV